MEEKILNHIGIIMDGNRRWARSRGLPAILGHREGVKAVERTLLAAKELGIPCVSLYAFSTENWKRPKSEVLGLMGLLKYYMKLKLEELNKENARIRFAGNISALSEDIQEILLDAEQKTRNNDSMQLVVCLNYGGRQEILDAVNKMIGDGVSLPVTEDVFRKYLYLPDKKVRIRKIRQVKVLTENVFRHRQRYPIPDHFVHCVEYFLPSAVVQADNKLH